MALELELQTQLGELELDVALRVDAGETLALAGPTGAGKTSVLRAVAGVLRPGRGRVSCAGEAWLNTEEGVDLPPERRRCGFLFQHYALFPHMTALDNVAYGVRGPRRERRARAHELMKRLGIEPLEDARPATLSGGERQRVALARALAPEPRALLLDEPLAALDARTRATASRVVAEALRGSGVPALLVTHDFGEAALLGDRVAVIDAGRVVQAGTAAELGASPGSGFVADFTGAVVLTGIAQPGEDDLTHVALDGGGTIASVDRAQGPVAASVYPWEIALEPAGESPHGSAQNRLKASVTSITEIGNRVRVGLQSPQPLTAEITLVAARQLGLAPGASVTATWKAAATRLVGR
jgi:molybdate transport system ATP-binding protein